jgi:hypothetical protein
MVGIGFLNFSKQSLLTFMQVQSIPNLKLLELLHFYNTNLKNNRQFKKYNFSGEKELELVKT